MNAELDELGGGMVPETAPETTEKTRAELEARAAELGVSFRSTISDARLLERILAAENAPVVTEQPEVTSQGNPEIDARTRAEMEAGAALVRMHQERAGG
jgi:hypothetical protein